MDSIKKLHLWIYAFDHFEVPHFKNSNHMYVVYEIICVLNSLYKGVNLFFL